ncbi:MAG: hypothetical protein AABY16_04230 [Nanoarchaeota archaeon]
MKAKTIIITLLIIIILILIFFPKPWIKGGFGGKTIGPGVAVYTEESSCLGFKQSYYPRGCSDCNTINNCYGITYAKKCYIKTYLNDIISKDITTCE